MFAPLLVSVALLICLAGMIVIIAFDTKRVLAGIDRYAWARAGYRRQVPNLLTLLSRAGLTSPWPTRLSGLSIVRFRRTLRRLVRTESNCPARLVDWHIGFWAHVHERLPLVEYALCVEMGQVLARLCQSLPQAERSRYVAEADQTRERLLQIRLRIERKFGTTWAADAAALFIVLKTLQVVFTEHGFHIHPRFLRLRELEQALEPIYPSV